VEPLPPLINDLREAPFVHRRPPQRNAAGRCPARSRVKAGRADGGSPARDAASNARIAAGAPSTKRTKETLMVGPGSVGVFMSYTHVLWRTPG
jgi:hypothetical protein